MNKLCNFENLKFDMRMRDAQKVLEAATQPHPICATYLQA